MMPSALIAGLGENDGMPRNVERVLPTPVQVVASHIEYILSVIDSERMGG